MSGPLVGPLPAPAVHVMTLNVRRPLPRALVWRRADRWRERAPRLRALLAAERPHVLALQEVLPEQAEAALEALGARYRLVGRGRSRRGTDESCPLIFDTDRLQLQDWSQSALSDRPTEPGSITWGNPLPRIVTRAALHDRQTGSTWQFFNTHLDPFSAHSRLRSATFLNGLGNEAGRPRVLCGDFNSTPQSPAGRSLRAPGGWTDSWDAAARRRTPEWDTYAAYRPPRSRGRRIDAILVSDDVIVDEAAIGAAPIRGGWASDHLPVHAALRTPKGSA